MTRKTILKQTLFAVIFILLGFVLSRAFVVPTGVQLLKFGKPLAAQAATGLNTGPERPASSDPAAPTDLHFCSSIEVAAYTNRIHVRCSNAAPGGIYFFALGTANANHAARVLTLLTMAHVTGRTIVIDYDPNDLEGTTIGCLASDCRLIGSVALQP